jgi:hypothetical protein
MWWDIHINSSEIHVWMLEWSRYNLNTLICGEIITQTQVRYTSEYYRVIHIITTYECYRVITLKYTYECYRVVQMKYTYEC